jgi:glycine dehydrogenase subunit 1
MRYLPHTQEDIAAMLKAVRIDSLEGLFTHIPDDCRRKEKLNIPQHLTEWELNDHMDTLAGSMAVSPNYKVFMGAGSYEHYVPAAVPFLLGRSEFVTAYTPYQPESTRGESGNPAGHL